MATVANAAEETTPLFAKPHEKFEDRSIFFDHFVLIDVQSDIIIEQIDYRILVPTTKATVEIQQSIVFYN